ncbi:MAG TPA: Crp/Fnr family transcriptional regulator [Aggregatilineaceae bacterium]|nr:Crp/Fnr family transcriptional regulator [Aggregatilineaceae bacterium]
MTSLLEHLHTIPYFSILDQQSLAAIAGQSQYHTFEAEEMIFLEGDPSAGLWLIEDGSVKVSKLSPEGAEYIMHLLGPGELFNVVAAMDGGPTPATVTALSLTSCWQIPVDVIAQAIERNPRMARAVINMLAARARQLNQQIENLTLYPVTARLARFLLAEAPSVAGVTRVAIAGHLATTPETISRVLAKLQHMGAIRFDRHRILITNVEMLRTIASLSDD